MATCILRRFYCFCVSKVTLVTWVATWSSADGLCIICLARYRNASRHRYCSRTIDNRFMQRCNSSTVLPRQSVLSPPDILKVLSRFSQQAIRTTVCTRVTWPFHLTLQFLISNIWYLEAEFVSINHLWWMRFVGHSTLLTMLGHIQSQINPAKILKYNNIN
jgi:hypothetical protein